MTLHLSGSEPVLADEFKCLFNSKLPVFKTVADPVTTGGLQLTFVNSATMPPGWDGDKIFTAVQQSLDEVLK